MLNLHAISIILYSVYYSRPFQLANQNTWTMGDRDVNFHIQFSASHSSLRHFDWRVGWNFYAPNISIREQVLHCITMSILCSLSLTVEVVTVLSCHSSCQGQVFSCTPFAFGKQCGFEEFCSLYDFVMACQSVLKDVLMAVHISSCFTLKLDCSHAVSVLILH